MAQYQCNQRLALATACSRILLADSFPIAFVDLCTLFPSKCAYSSRYSSNAHPHPCLTFSFDLDLQRRQRRFRVDSLGCCCGCTALRPSVRPSVSDCDNHCSAGLRRCAWKFRECLWVFRIDCLTSKYIRASRIINVGSLASSLQSDSVAGSAGWL